MIFMIDENTIKTTFGIMLKKLRVQNKLTQEQLAEIIGLQPQTITKIETGRVFVSCETLSALCNFFKVEPNLFFNKTLTSETNNSEYINKITSLLPSLTNERKKDIYKIILALEN